MGNAVESQKKWLCGTMAGIALKWLLDRMVFGVDGRIDGSTLLIPSWEITVQQQ